MVHHSTRCMGVLMSEQIFRPQQIRTFEIVQYITAPIECETLDDLPANLQDAVLMALEQKAKEVELPLAIIAVRCDKDIDSTDPKRVWFLHIVASEIVLAIDQSNMPPWSGVQ